MGSLPLTHLKNMQLRGQLSNFSEGWGFTVCPEEALLGSLNITALHPLHVMCRHLRSDLPPSVMMPLSFIASLAPASAFFPEVVQVTAGQM